MAREAVIQRTHPGNGRVSYASAATAAREASRRLAVYPGIVPKDVLRVWIALLINLPLYSKLEDEAVERQLAPDAGLPPNKAKAALKWLREHHFIYRPQSMGGRSRGGKGYAGKTKILDDREAEMHRLRDMDKAARLAEPVITN